MSKPSNLRNQLATIRSKARINDAEMRRSGAGVAASFIIGALEKSGRMNDIPTLAGLPRTVTLAFAAKLGASYASGSAADYLDGVGDAAANVAVYQFAKGPDVSGAHVAGARSDARAARAMERRAAALEARIARQLRDEGVGEDDIERELAALEIDD